MCVYCVSVDLCGRRVNIKKDSDKIRDLNELFEHHIGDDPKNWIDINVKENSIDCIMV